jgi:sporulation integral membrane protein YtvI
MDDYLARILLKIEKKEYGSVSSNISSLLILAVVIALAYYLFTPLLPLLIALILAILIDPVVEFGQRHLRLSRPLSVTLTFLGIFSISGLLLYIGATKLILEFYTLIQGLFKSLPDIQNSLTELALQAQLFYAALPIEASEGLSQGVSSLVKGISNMLSSLAGGLVSMAAALPNLLIVALIILISYFLFSLELPKLKYYLYQFFTPQAQKKLDVILQDLSQALIGFIRAQILISFLMYIIVAAGLLILGAPYALALALVIIVVDILPILGTGAVMVPWAIWGWSQGRPSLAIGLLILYAITIIFRRIAEPKILGQSLGISTLATLISMFAGFQVMGVMGLFFGPFIVIIIKSLRKANILNIRFDW